MIKPPLVLQLQLVPGSPQPTGAALFINEGSADVRLWNPGNQWGDAALSFEVLQDHETWPVVRQPQVYTRNVPSFTSVPAGTEREWQFELNDDQWQAALPLSQLLVPGVRLVAVYQATPSPESEEHKVWTGRLRSEPVVLKG